jgi:hypothetical protein
MIAKPLDKIEAADIQALVTNGDEERRTMDFKRDLPGMNEDAKKELRADVTSFANASGGDLIFGVDEAGGVATAVLGLPGVDADAEIRRIEAVIQSSIDPRVPGFESRAIPIPGKGPVIVVRVPKSWRGPHLIKLNDTFRMFGRNSKGKYIFDATEIRSAFLGAEAVPSALRTWRNDRIATIVARQTPVPLRRGPALAVHVVPFVAASSRQVVTVANLMPAGPVFGALGGSPNEFRMNVDGIVRFWTWRDGADGTNCYMHAFRNGAVESVWANIVDETERGEVLASTPLERNVHGFVWSALNGLRAVQVPPPFLISVALLGMQGVKLLPQRSLFIDFDGAPIDRDLIVLPEVLCETYEPDGFTLLRPIFDAVWNACGYSHSWSYDGEGNWKGDHR